MWHCPCSPSCHLLTCPHVKSPHYLWEVLHKSLSTINEEANINSRPINNISKSLQSLHLFQTACLHFSGWKRHCPQTSLLRYHHTQPEHAQDSCPWASQGSFPSLFLVGFKSASYIQIMRVCVETIPTKSSRTLHLVPR